MRLPSRNAVVSISVLGAVIVVACGGKVVADEDDEGKGGGSQGVGGNTSVGPGPGPGPTSVGNGGSVAVAASAGVGGSGPSLVEACQGACSAIAGCTVGDCVSTCLGADPEFGFAFKPFLECIAGLATPTSCDLPDECVQALEQWLVCESWCVVGAGWSGTGDRSGACTSLLDGACGPVGAYETQCEPLGDGTLSCVCFEDGQFQGECIDDEKSACDPTFGCCGTVFFVPG